MSVDANKALVQEFHQAVIANKNLNVVSQYMRDPLVDHAAPGETATLEQYKQSLAVYFDAFPDLTATIEDLTGDGDFVVCRLSLSGTQQGTFMGAAPSGKSFTVGSIQTYRVSHGKIVERWQSIDLMGLRMQLGIQ
jgi:steroid delta-isomerase-like uncharacterized protein